jgi:hypothetical protein
LSLEDRFDEVRQLIIIGKEKGFLLYDEVNDLLPADLTSSPEDLDELMSLFAAAGIDLVDSEKGYREREGMERARVRRGEEGIELDLTPGALDKTNDPVRMYLREMGTVPLLTREGEVAIAKRIEQGKLSVIKSISRMPAITKAVIRMGEALKAASAPSASWSSSTTRRSPTTASRSAPSSSCAGRRRAQGAPGGREAAGEALDSEGPNAREEEVPPGPVEGDARARSSCRGSFARSSSPSRSSAA